MATPGISSGSTSSGDLQAERPRTPRRTTDPLDAPYLISNVYRKAQQGSLADMESKWVKNHMERFGNCWCNPRTRSPSVSGQMLYTAWTAKGATRTTSAKPERPYKAEYANIKEQSGEEGPPLSSGCTQLKLVTASTLKTPRLLTTAASKGNAW